MITGTDKKLEAYYKNIVLSFLIRHNGEYGPEDIIRIFDLAPETVRRFIEEYSSMGFTIKEAGGKFLIKNFPEKISRLVEELDARALKKHALLDELKRRYEREQQELDLQTVLKQYGKSVREYIDELCTDGYLYLENGQIRFTLEPLEYMEDENLFKLLLFLSVMKNIYPGGNKLHEVFQKCLIQYEQRGYSFNRDAVICPNKHRMSFLDEGHLDLVEDALCRGRKIEITYDTESGRQPVKVSPSGIVYNNSKDAWYVVDSGQGEQIYRVDKIIGLKIIDEEIAPAAFNKNLYHSSIGISTEDIVEVEVLFEKGEYIHKKLLLHARGRDSASIEEREDSYLLKDKVRGILEFKKWVRSFGRSATCLKPEKLRESIKKDLKLMCERYGVDFDG